MTAFSKETWDVIRKHYKKIKPYSKKPRDRTNGIWEKLKSKIKK